MSLPEIGTSPAVEDGMGGDLVKATSRSNMLAWFCFLALLITFIAREYFLAIKPTPILGIKGGRVVGEVKWYDGPQSELDVLIDVKEWGEHYFAMDSSNIFEHATLALAPMSEQVQRETINRWDATGYLQGIQAAQQDSIVKFEEGCCEVSVIDKDEKLYKATIRATVIVEIPDVDKPVVFEFNTKLKVHSVYRSEENPFGLDIVSLGDAAV